MCIYISFWLILLMLCIKGFTSDVKVWEVGFDRVGNFIGCKRVFELKGYLVGVYSFSFNSDFSRYGSLLVIWMLKLSVYVFLIFW